jgi:hypothetical protein
MIFSKRTAGIVGGLALSLVACQSGPPLSSPGVAGPETIGATVAKLTTEAAALPPLLRRAGRSNTLRRWRSLCRFLRDGCIDPAIVAPISPKPRSATNGRPWLVPP